MKAKFICFLIVAMLWFLFAILGALVVESAANEAGIGFFETTKLTYYLIVPTVMFLLNIIGIIYRKYIPSVFVGLLCICEVMFFFFYFLFFTGGM